MIVGIGLDIIDIDQVVRALEKGHEAFCRRVFTHAEQEYCRAQAYPAQHFAARFAAKEAVLKALGTGWSSNIKWTDIAISLRPSGQPLITLDATVSQIAATQGIESWHLSLSHSRFYAVACAIAENHTQGRPS